MCRNAQRLKALTGENEKLKKLLVESIPDNGVFKDISAKKW